MVSAATTDAKRPRPTINRDVEMFWQGVQEGRLLTQSCSSCHGLRFPFQPYCGHCHSDSWEVRESPGRGAIFSFTKVHHPPQDGFVMPYVVGLIELDEGVRIVGMLKDEPAGGFYIGMRVGVSFTRDDDFVFADFSPLVEEASQ